MLTEADNSFWNWAKEDLMKFASLLGDELVQGLPDIQRFSPELKLKFLENNCIYVVPVQQLSIVDLLKKNMGGEDKLHVAYPESLKFQTPIAREVAFSPLLFEGDPEMANAYYDNLSFLYPDQFRIRKGGLASEYVQIILQAKRRFGFEVSSNFLTATTDPPCKLRGGSYRYTVEGFNKLGVVVNVTLCSPLGKFGRYIKPHPFLIPRGAV